ncbi:hypothetical protein V493_07317 [Pseudogymnoascus sp. VKM F-4281 (FW-2241)]|nr:hypothetical protein V493_07317 [Pseudogymnoascus sp. VKM F-4281 (FW-2241)]
MREKLQSTAYALGFGCPNHNTLVLETLDFCNSCIEYMKVTASSALAAFGEMNITETDGTGRNQNNRNAKERNSGSLVLLFLCGTSRRVGPRIVRDLAQWDHMISGAAQGLAEGKSGGILLISWILGESPDTSDTEAKPTGGHEPDVESLCGKSQPGIGSGISQTISLPLLATKLPDGNAASRLSKMHLSDLPIELAHSASIAQRPRPAAPSRSRSRSRHVSQDRSLLHGVQSPLPEVLQPLHEDNRGANDEGLVAILVDERGPVQGVQQPSFGEEKQRGVVSDLRLGSERKVEAGRGRQGWLSSGSWFVMVRAELY